MESEERCVPCRLPQLLSPSRHPGWGVEVRASLASLTLAPSPVSSVVISFLACGTSES